METSRLFYSAKSQNQETSYCLILYFQMEAKLHEEFLKGESLNRFTIEFEYRCDVT